MIVIFRTKECGTKLALKNIPIKLIIQIPVTYESLDLLLRKCFCFLFNDDLMFKCIKVA